MSSYLFAILWAPLSLILLVVGVVLWLLATRTDELNRYIPRAISITLSALTSSVIFLICNLFLAKNISFLSIPFSMIGYSIGLVTGAIGGFMIGRHHLVQKTKNTA